MTPYECCIMYSALKLHFNQGSFDYHRYNGKVKISKDTFEKRKDKYDFVKLVRKISDDEMENFLISNFLRKTKIWIKELLMEESYDCFLLREKTMQSLSYIFKNDLQKLKDECGMEEVMKCRDGNHPILLRKVLRNDIHLEIFVIMDLILNFTPKWNTMITDTFLWPQFFSMINKYKPFLMVDLPKFRNMMREVIA